MVLVANDTHYVWPRWFRRELGYAIAVIPDGRYHNGTGGKKVADLYLSHGSAASSLEKPQKPLIDPTC